MEEMQEGAQVTRTTPGGAAELRPEQGTGALVGVPGKRVEGCPLI